MKRLIALMLVSVMIVMCAPFALADDGPIEIKWSFGLGGKLGELMLSLVDEYNNSQNKVHVTAQQYGSYGQSIQAFHADPLPETHRPARGLKEGPSVVVP